MKLNEAEMRMAYQIESTNQASALHEIYMTWRYSQNQATKDTAESLLKKLRPLSDKECMDVIRERVCNPNGQLGAIEYAILEQPRPPEPGRENPVQANPVLDLLSWENLNRKTPHNEIPKNYEGEHHLCPQYQEIPAGGAV